jgi:hypothetical protein
MTITVGTDTYLSVPSADTYWSSRSNTTWAAATTAQKEAALLEATQYIDGAYSFIGTQITTNALAFPRYGVTIPKGNLAGAYYDSATIPPQIQAACAELALEALSGRLAPSLERGGRVKREKVDTLEVEYQDTAPSGKTYDFVALLLAPLLLHGKNTVLLTRV